MIFLDWDKQKYLQFSIVWDVRKETEWWESEQERRVISLVWIQSLNIDPLFIPSIQIYNPLHFNDNSLKRNTLSAHSVEWKQNTRVLSLEKISPVIERK